MSLIMSRMKRAGMSTALRAFFICLIAVSVFPSLFILIHAEHAHDSEGAEGGCSVCIQMVVAHSLLKTGETAKDAALAFDTVSSGSPAPILISSRIYFSTLITLNIQKNN